VSSGALDSVSPVDPGDMSWRPVFALALDCGARQFSLHG
jgi:hypothetical protein